MNSSKIGGYLLLSVLCLLASKTSTLASVTNVSVPNFSFELFHPGAGNGGDYANQNPPGNTGPTGILFDDWVTTFANYQIFQNPVSNLTTPGTTEGTYYADEYIPFGNTVSAVTENPVATIDNDATYLLTFSLGIKAGNNVYGNPSTPTDMTIELLSGTNVLASTAVSGATLSLTPGTFNDYSTGFTTLLGNDSAYVGQSLSIELLITPTGGGQEAQFDNVRLTETTVPEPGTWAMMLFGAGGLVILGRRRMLA